MASQTTHAVGIDLGTTYSCVAYLNDHGEPVALPNSEGELSTPSVVFFDGDEVLVGTEALRNAILHPDRVVQNSKRFIGNPDQRWVIDYKPYTPVDIAALILKNLLAAAQEHIGPIEQAVVTVPAQFSDFQRHATIEAGHRAGLQRVDIINEPVAAALCYVLGSEGLWFTELADEQRILVYDLGGGTFDLSLVRYQKNEVSVIASSGDLNLGGIDWNGALEAEIAGRFEAEFGADPRSDPESRQFLALEVEQAKRSLSVRPRTLLSCQHTGRRKTYQVEQGNFERLTKKLVDHTAEITKRMLKDNKLGWAHVDVVLTTGGASRMPMIRRRLKQLSGRTLNTTLSPDLSISHGATYYAGMLLTNNKFAKSILNAEASERLSRIRQRSVNARALGILVRDATGETRIPYFFIPANTSLPNAATQTFGTVIPDQRKVRLQIVESGTSPEAAPVILGTCEIEHLPSGLKEGSEVAVTMRYDSEARVHVSAQDVTSGKQASTEIIRQENLVQQLQTDHLPDAEVAVISPDISARRQRRPSPTVPRAASGRTRRPVATRNPSPQSKPARTARQPSIGGLEIGSLADADLENADQPIPLCDACGEPVDARGNCKACGNRPKSNRRPSGKKAAHPQKKRKRPAGKSKQTSAPVRRQASTSKPIRPAPQSPSKQASSAKKLRRPLLPSEEEIIELDDSAIISDKVSAPAQRKKAETPQQSIQKRPAETGQTAPKSGESVQKESAKKSVAAARQQGSRKKTKKKAGKPPRKGVRPAQPQPTSDAYEAGEEEFWQIVD